MIRQRINLRTPVLAYVVRVLTVVLGLGLFWYGLMVVLLAVKVSPDTRQRDQRLPHRSTTMLPD